VDCSQFTWTDLGGTEYSCFSQCPRDISDTCFIGHDGWTGEDFTLNNVGYYGVLPVAVFELFFVLCFGRRSPEEIRDAMFSFLVSRRMMGDFKAMPAEKRRRPPRSIRMRLAQAGALFFYLFAACTYLVCLPFFVFSIVWQERLLRFFPDAESVWEMSQWLPWVGVGLTLGAAIVGKYHHNWHIYLDHFFFGHTKGHPTPAAKAKRKGNNWAHWLRRHTWRTRSRIWLEWRDLKEFILYPFYLVLDESRERTSDHPTVKFSFAGSLPFPGDEERNTKDHYRGPWIKDDDTWKHFPVEFQVEADNRTLESWEKYQSRATGVNQRIVYSVMLPTVPTHPDRRTVTANANASHIEEKVTVNTNPSKKEPDVTQALIPGARKHSTVAYNLQAVSISSDSDSTKQSSDTNSLHKTDTAGTSKSNIASQAQSREQINQTPEPSKLPRNFTPTPGLSGGPLNSHHFGRAGTGAGGSTPLASHTEVDSVAESDPATYSVGQAH
jgi:hypothetical protein